MARVEITLPDHLDMQISQLVEQGEFLDQENAVQELLSTGLKAYKTSGPRDGDPQIEEDGMMGHEEEYVF